MHDKVYKAKIIQLRTGSVHGPSNYHMQSHKSNALLRGGRGELTGARCSISAAGSRRALEGSAGYAGRQTAPGRSERKKRREEEEEGEERSVL